MHPFLERLSRGPMVSSGAVGTMLQAKGLPPVTTLEEYNLSHPEAVAEIHPAYCEAGAEMIGTNTFGANPLKLKKAGLADKAYDLTMRGRDRPRGRAEGGLRLCRHRAERGVPGSVGGYHSGGDVRGL